MGVGDQSKNLVEGCMYPGHVKYFKLICRQNSCYEITVTGNIEEIQSVLDQLEISQNILNYTQSS